jgi:iron-sulfur cluster assembly accessory protein
VTDHIQLTEAAARRVAAIAAKQSKAPVLRLSVDGGGCAGFTYKFELGSLEDGDAIAETDGVKLIVDPVSLDLVQGSAVDFVEDLGGSAFKVTNPNAASGCGCGSQPGSRLCPPRRLDHWCSRRAHLRAASRRRFDI